MSAKFNSVSLTYLGHICFIVGTLPATVTFYGALEIVLLLFFYIVFYILFYFNIIIIIVIVIKPLNGNLHVTFARLDLQTKL